MSHQKIYDYNISLHGNNHQVFSKLQKLIETKIKQLEACPCQNHQDEILMANESLKNVKANKEMYYQLYLNYLPKTIEELFITPVPGIKFNNLNI